MAVVAARWQRRQLGGAAVTAAERRRQRAAMAAAAEALRRWLSTVVVVESMGTVVLVPQLACCGFVFVVVSPRFLLGRGRREDSADVVVESGARGDVHYGRRCADNAKSNAEDNICYTKFFVKLNNYFILS